MRRRRRRRVPLHAHRGDPRHPIALHRLAQRAQLPVQLLRRAHRALHAALHLLQRFHHALAHRGLQLPRLAGLSSLRGQQRGHQAELHPDLANLPDGPANPDVPPPDRVALASFRGEELLQHDGGAEHVLAELPGRSGGRGAVLEAPEGEVAEEGEEAVDGRTEIGDELEVGGVGEEGIPREETALRGGVGDLREVEKAAREGGVERERERR